MKVSGIRESDGWVYSVREASAMDEVYSTIVVSSGTAGELLGFVYTVGDLVTGAPLMKIGERIPPLSSGGKRAT